MSVGRGGQMCGLLCWSGLGRGTVAGGRRHLGRGGCVQEGEIGGSGGILAG